MGTATDASENINKKLDLLLAAVEKLSITVEEIQDAQAETQESVNNLSLPGSGYGIETPED